MNNAFEFTTEEKLSVGLKVLKNSEGYLALADANNVLLTSFQYWNYNEKKCDCMFRITHEVNMYHAEHTESIRLYESIDGIALVNMKNDYFGDERYCFINNKGELIGDPAYYEASEFKNGLALVQKYNNENPYYTCINRFGIEVFPSKYNIQNLSDKYIYAKFDNKMVLLDYQLNTIFNADSNYTNIEEIQDNIFKVRIENQYYKIVGIHDTNISKEVCELNFDLLETTHVKNIFKIKYKNANEKNHINRTYYINIYGDRFDNIGKIRNSIIIVEAENKFGYVDNNGTLLINCEYDFAASFYNDRAVVKQGNNCFLINKVGNNIMDIDNYDSLYTSGFDTYYTICKYSQNRKNEDKYEYSEVIGVIKENKYGFIDLNGNLMIKPIYDYHVWFESNSHFYYEGEDYATIQKDGRYGIINSSGNYIIEPLYEEEFEFYDDLTIVKKDSFYGIISDSGKIIRECEYKSIKRLRKGNYSFSVVNNNEIKYGLLNKKGELIKKPIYSCFDLLQYNYLVCFQTENYQLYGVISEDGKELISINHEEIIAYKEEKSKLIIKKNNLFGVFNEYGDEILPIIYDEIIFKNDFGNEIISEEDDDDYEIISKHIIDRFLIKKNNLLGVFGEYGKEIIPIIYDEIIYHNEIDRFRVKKNNQFGVLSNSGEEIVPLTYDEIIFKNDICGFIVKKNNLFGIISQNGNVVIPIEYVSISEYSDDRAIIQDQNKKFGYIDNTPRIVIPPKYDIAKPFICGSAIVVLNDKEYEIDHGGSNFSQVDKTYDEPMWTERELREARRHFLSNSQYDPNDEFVDYDPDTEIY